MSNLFKRFGWGMGTAIAVLVGLWLVLMVIAPNLMMVHFALKPNLFPSEIGGPKDVYTFANFTDLFADPVHRSIFFKTIRGSALVTLVTLVVTYPLAYWLAQVAKPRSARMMLIALIIPFWINEVLRTLAWYILLALNGPLNVVLQAVGLMDEPVRWFGDVGVLAGMTYAYILFMLFPISNSIATLEPAQIDAARDLGASTWRVHRRVVIPHAKAGIATGCVFTFMLAAGSYVAPALLGSPGSRWFTEIIYNWFFEGGNWNKGASYALVLLVLCMAVILLLLKLFRVNLTDVAK